MLLFLLSALLSLVGQVANPAEAGNQPAPTPPAPPAPAPDPGISAEEHRRVLTDNAVLKARLQYPQVPEDLLRKFKGEKPDDVIEFAKFAAEQLKPLPPGPQSASAPAPVPTQAPGAAAPGVHPSPGEPVPAPGVGGTISPAAVSDLRRKELREKVIRKTATQEEAAELADTTLIDAFNRHMKERRMRAA